MTDFHYGFICGTTTIVAQGQVVDAEARDWSTRIVSDPTLMGKGAVISDTLKPSRPVAGTWNATGEWLLLVIYFLLAAQGLLNYLIGEGTVWKQLLIVIATIVVMSYAQFKDNVTAVVVFALAGILCMVTGLRNVALGEAIYNIFFYVSWVPFWLFGKQFDIKEHGRRHVIINASIIILSALGLWIQLTTHYLDFLKVEDESYIREQNNEAQRFFLIYTASLGVMPPVATFYLTALMAGCGAALRFILLAALAACAIATGSLAGILMLGACVGMAVVGISWMARGVLLAVVVGLVLVAATGALDVVNVQLDRITTNTAESESNQGRIDLWNQSLSLIDQSSGDEFVFGRGIGTTNGNYFGDALYPNGESSFFQATTEGGIIGLALRLFPFVAIVMAIPRSPWRSYLAIYVAGFFAACFVAPIFALYGVQCSLGLVAGIAQRRASEA